MLVHICLVILLLRLIEYLQVDLIRIYSETLLQKPQLRKRQQIGGINNDRFIKKGLI